MLLLSLPLLLLPMLMLLLPMLLLLLLLPRVATAGTAAGRGDGHRACPRP